MERELRKSSVRAKLLLKVVYYMTIYIILPPLIIRFLESEDIHINLSIYPILAIGLLKASSELLEFHFNKKKHFILKTRLIKNILIFLLFILLLVSSGEFGWIHGRMGKFIFSINILAFIIIFLILVFIMMIAEILEIKSKYEVLA